MIGAKHFQKLIWALALSIIAHALFWFGPQIHLSFQQTPPTIDVRLVKLLPAPKFKAAPMRKPTQRAPSRKTAADTPPPVQTTPADNPALPLPATNEPVQTAASPPITPNIPPFPLPEHAEIQYFLYKGINGLNVGTVVQTWNMQNNHYSLTSIAQATGIFSLIRSGKFIQTSQGKLTDNGLEPDAFWTQRGQSADSTDSAQFDRQSKQLVFGPSQNNQSVTLSEGTQDLLSFIYQIATAPPPSGRFQLFITNGRKLDSYEYQVIGEEMLDLPIGQTRSLHLSRIHTQNEDGTDIWLGLDQHNLPVKIRFTDREGGVAEQVAHHIQIK